jgi:hypothetical protein
MNDWLEMHALADGHLTGEDRESALRLAECDAACRAELESVQTLKSVLRSKISAQTCARTWSRCMDRIEELERTRRVEKLVGRYAWGLCSIFLVVICCAAILNRMAGPSDLRSGEVAQILSGLSASRAAPSQPEDLRKWIEDAPLALDIGKLQVRGGFEQIRGGRQCASYFLEDGKGPSVLLVVRGVNMVEGVEPVVGHGRYSAGRVADFNFVFWSDRGFGMFVVGKRPSEDLCAIGDQVRLER